MAVDVQELADQAADGQAGDEEHRVGAVGHILDHGIDAQAEGRKAHGVEHHLLVLGFDAFVDAAAHNAAGENGARVYDGSDHDSFPPVFLLSRLFFLKAFFIHWRCPRRTCKFY